jgi:hypothetical protein
MKKDIYRLCNIFPVAFELTILDYAQKEKFAFSCDATQLDTTWEMLRPVKWGFYCKKIKTRFASFFGDMWSVNLCNQLASGWL